jgi:hypothetical protein
MQPVIFCECFSGPFLF